MKKNKLGLTSLDVSIMGVGGIPLQRFDDENAYGILKTALDYDVNFIDTARGYGRSEELIGTAISLLGRDKFIVATKSMKRDRAGMESELAASLKCLKTEYIDLYQFHFVTHLSELEQILSSGGAMEALQEGKKSGKVGHIGITSHNKKLALAAIETGRFETVQFPYSFLETDAEEVFASAKKAGMGTIVMKPVGGGAVKNVALSLRWIAASKDVDTLIPGVDDASQLASNADVLDSRLLPLNDEELATLASEKTLLGNDFCRRCDYCQPCPAGIPISIIFNTQAYYERYGLIDWARGKYLACAKNITDCLDCGACESRCPYGLKIRNKLKRTHELFVK